MGTRDRDGHRRPARRRAALIARRALAALALACGAPAAAQTPIQPTPPLDHWTRGVLVRLAGMGLLEAGEATTSWPLPGARVAALLGSAAARSDLASVRAYRGYLGSAVDTVPEFAAWLGADFGFLGQERQLRAGTARIDQDPQYPGPHAVDDVHRLGGSATASLRPLDWLLASATLSNVVPGRPIDRDPRLAEAYIAAHAGVFDLRAGRVPLSFGPTGSFVLHTPPPFDGVAVDVDGFRLPWFLRHVGTIRIAQAIARMDRSGNFERPWFVATRVTFAPGPSLAVGVQRGLLLGGEGNEPVTARRVLLALLGRTDERGKDSDFENQVVEVDVFWKIPAAPASVRLEWAFDDAGGAFHRVPAIVAGFDWHVLPFAPSLGAGLEAIVMTPSVAGHPPWYQHLALGDGWTDRGDLLGHPLGGHGREVGLTLSTSGAVQGTARAYWRDRGAENLFAPDREGTAVGLAADGVVFVSDQTRVRVDFDAEHHASGWAWRAQALFGLRVRF